MAADKTLPDGIYVPTVTFFKDDAAQSLDLDTYNHHVKFLASSGIAGIVVQGSTGEAVALSREERNAITIATRKVVDSLFPNSHFTVIVGTVGAQTTHQAIQLTEDGAENGGDFALVLPPSYYASQLSTNDIQKFYEDVADKSPLPVLIYSYPAVSGGIDMNTDLLQVLAKHPNIVGIKHTDHSLSKQTRLAGLRESFGKPFSVLGGASDYLLATLSVGCQGAITGMGNVTPRAVVKAYELYKAGKVNESRALAYEIAQGEWALGKGGINGTKYATAFHNGLPESAAVPRRPVALAPPTNKEWQEKEITSLVAIERKLEEEAGVKGPYGKFI